MKISTTLLAALCSGAQLFAQSGFAPAYQLVTPSSEFQNAVAADLDGDGDIDVISANSSLSSIKGMYSYRNDGAGNFTTAVIGTGQSGWANCIADLDGDGKPDLLSIDATHLWWYRNLGNMQFSSPLLLTNNITDGRAVTAADSDGDGDLDIFFGEGSADRFGMLMNLGGASFGPKTIINTTSTDVDDIVASDLDGDGDLDLVVSCLNVQDVAWFENLGNNTFGPQHVLTTSTIGNTALIAADLDGDGDNDIVTSAFGSDDVTWIKNLGNGNFSAPITISSSVDGAYDINAGDVDGDGDLDLVCPAPEGGYVSYFINDGSGVFTQGTVPESFVYPWVALLADINGDGLQDIVSASLHDGKLLWCDAATPNFSGIHSIAKTASLSLKAIPVDVDGDGDMDVVGISTGDGKVALYKNLGGAGFAEQQVIDGNAVGVLDLEVGDINGDGKPDLMAALSGLQKLVWYRNLGNGNFAAPSTVAAGFNFVTGCGLADIDGDGDLDALAADRNGYEASYYLNNGTGTFGPKQILDDVTNGPKDVLGADLDNDGDQDIIILSAYDQRVMWLRNNGGLSFSSPMVAIENVNGADEVALMDLDGNGYVDMFAAGQYTTKIYYALNSATGFGPRLDTGFGIINPTAVKTGDMDGDGDLDLVVSSNGSNKLSWLEVENGAFVAKNNIANVYEYPQDVAPADFDGDGSLDVVACYLHTVAIFINQAEVACNLYQNAPVGLAKVNQQNRVIVGWYKALPNVKYSAADNIAVDIEFWATKNLATNTPILNAPHSLLSKKTKPGQDFFWWPLNYSRPDIDPLTRYTWRVRVYCDAGNGPVSPWSATSTFDTPGFQLRSTLGEGEHDGFGPSLLQNLVNTELTVLLGDAEGQVATSYWIYSTTGALVGSGNLQGSQQVISVAGLNAGLYQLRIEGPFGPEALQFVKE